MSKTDPIADFLTMIRNATRAKMDSVDVEQSKMNREILEIMKKEGYISDFKPLEASRKIKVYLKYVSGRNKEPQEGLAPGFKGLYEAKQDAERIKRFGRRGHNDPQGRADEQGSARAQGRRGSALLYLVINIIKVKNVKSR